MINNRDFFNYITQGVFWDCNLDELSFPENKNFLIARVLMRGLDKDISYIHQNFTLDEIVESVNNCPECDAICKNYYKTIKEYNYDL